MSQVMRGRSLVGLVFVLALGLKRGSSAASSDTPTPCFQPKVIETKEHPLAAFGVLDVQGEFEVEIHAGSSSSVAVVEADGELASFVSVTMVRQTCPQYQVGVDFFGDDTNQYFGLASATECGGRCESQGSPYFTFVDTTISSRRISQGTCFCKFGPGMRTALEEVTSGQACSPPGLTAPFADVLSVGYTQDFSRIVERCGAAVVRKARPKINISFPASPGRVIARDGADVTLAGVVASRVPLALRAFDASIELARAQVPSLQLSASGDTASVSLVGNAKSTGLLGVSALSGGNVFLRGSFAAQDIDMLAAAESTVRLSGSARAFDTLTVTALEQSIIDVGSSVRTPTMMVTAAGRSAVTESECETLQIDMTTGATADITVTVNVTGSVAGGAALVVRGSGDTSSVVQAGGTVSRARL